MTTTKRPKLKRWDQRATAALPNLLKVNDAAVREIFKRRAIHEDVWRGRPYTPYDAGDMLTVLDAEPGYDTDKARPGVKQKVDQRPGLVMSRRGFWGSARQLAQLRPFKFKEIDPTFDITAYAGSDAEDEGIFMGVDPHEHYGEYSHAHLPDSFIETKHGRFDSSLVRFVLTTTREIAQRNAPPVRRDRDAAADADRDEKRDKAFARQVRQHVQIEHPEGRPADHREHEHHHTPSRRHLAKHHGGRDTRVKHSHSAWAKYLYPAKQAVNEASYLIDCHPLALTLLEAGGDVCYFALEGLLKNDAILSVGYTVEGTGTPVINCGSVTLWPDAELRRITQTYLVGFRLVVVVPDSDGSRNRLVSSQADQLSARLIKYGATAVVAYPPADASCDNDDGICTHWTREIDEYPEHNLCDPAHKAGVDDMLGNRGTLAQLIVTTRGDALEQITEHELSVQSSADGHYKPGPRAATDWLVLNAILACADPDDGYAVVAQRTLAENVVWSEPVQQRLDAARDRRGGDDHGRMMVRDAIESLERRGIIRRIDIIWPGDTGDAYPTTTFQVVNLRLIPPRVRTPLGEYVAQMGI